MNDENKEALSALVDDELNEVARSRLLDRMSENAELRATWERYHLMRDCLRDAVPADGAQMLAARIKSQLASEPVALVQKRPRRRSSFLKPIAGAAIAASVAVVAVLGVQTFTRSTDTTEAVADSGLRWAPAKPSVEQRLNHYLVSHSEYQRNGMHGMLPYARIAGYDAGK